MTPEQIMLPRECGRCGSPALVVWGTSWARDEYACAEHDPVRQPGWTASAMPPGFHYRVRGFPQSDLLRDMYAPAVAALAGMNPGL